MEILVALAISSGGIVLAVALLVGLFLLLRTMWGELRTRWDQGQKVLVGVAMVLLAGPVVALALVVVLVSVFWATDVALDEIGSKGPGLWQKARDTGERILSAPSPTPTPVPILSPVPPSPTPAPGAQSVCPTTANAGTRCGGCYWTAGTGPPNSCPSPGWVVEGTCTPCTPR